MEEIIESPVHMRGYENNTGYDINDINGETGIEGVVFTDFSTIGGKGFRQSEYTLSPLPSHSKIIKALKTNELDAINHFLSMMFINWNGAKIKRGNLENGNSKIISSTPQFLQIFQNLCIKVYENLQALNAELSNSGTAVINVTENDEQVEKTILTGTTQTYDNIPSLAELINVLSRYVYNNLEKTKTITKGDYQHDQNKPVKDLEDVINILSNLCSDFNTYVYKEKTKTNAIKNSCAMSTPCGQNLNNPGLPVIIEDGELYDVIYTNSSNDSTNKPSYTITITNNAALSNLPQGCSIKVPDGDLIEVECPYGGYCEINYLRLGNIIYVRAA